MSEPISAFAAYRKAAQRTSNGNKKGHNSKNTGASPTNERRKKSKTNKNLNKSKSPQKEPKSTTTKQNGVTKEKVAPIKPKEITKKTASKQQVAAAEQKGKNADNKGTKNLTEPSKKQQQQKSQKVATNGKPASNNKIKESEIDALVEQLLGDSPSQTKKLTKSQQKKKQELEDYLVQQLGNDDEHASEGEMDYQSVSEEDELMSGSDEEVEYSTTADEFSDEYTINTHSDEDDEEGESFYTSTYSSSDSPATRKPVATSRKNSAATKRKNNDKASGKAANGVPVAKKTRQAENAAGRRKSMPAAAAAAAAVTTVDSKAKFEKTATEQRRHSIAAVTKEADSTDRTVKVTVKTVDASAVKMEPLSPPSNIAKMNSIKEGEKTFGWLLSPLSLQEFFSKYWETAACLIKRKGSNYYSHLISFEAIDQMLIKNHIEFTKNIDVTSYKNGERETHNPEGRAMPPVVWDHYGQGCSIRLLNPQTFLPQLYMLNASLQEYFHCLIGANAYLTPPNSQGFAPHYDDIEAFVLQIEGRKRWRLYKPRTEAEHLARFSSKNFQQQEIGKPIFDEVLEPGDMLYFPRGTIHQACTEPGHHSLHITLSVYQKQSYADLFERMIPLVLKRAIESNVDMRRGLPLHTFQHAGIAYSDNDTKERADLIRSVTKLMGQCLHSAPLEAMMDAAVDQLAKKYQHEALPPHILSAEHARTIFGSRSKTNERGECLCDYEIDERTNVRLLRANIMRLVQEEEDKLRLYYYLDNSKEYCEYEPNFIEIEAEEAASVALLIRSYPEYVGVAQLPLADEERKVQLATALWERGLLMTEKPFK